MNVNSKQVIGYIRTTLAYMEQGIPHFIVGCGLGIWTMFLDFRKSVSYFSAINPDDFRAIVFGFVLASIVMAKLLYTLFNKASRPTITQKIKMSRAEFDKLSPKQVHEIFKASGGSTIIFVDEEQ